MDWKYKTEPQPGSYNIAAILDLSLRFRGLKTVIGNTRLNHSQVAII
jgi:hypothetical protein